MNYSLSQPAIIHDSHKTHEITLAWRLGGAGVILLVSAVASSFPSLAKRAPRIDPPEVVFFIGKHFGTGVILSTAFIHLMQEGFESLNDPRLPGKWKDWSGAIVLSSFLAIFLVEYISTAYVEHLSERDGEHSDNKMSNHEHDHSHFTPYQDEPEPDVEQPPDAFVSTDDVSTERNVEQRPRVVQGSSRRSSIIGHHRHESPSAHEHRAGPRLEPRRRISSMHISREESEALIAPMHSHGHGHGHGPGPSQEVSRKTRIISILILQLGIMLHSIVVGLTLSITDGANFTTLLTALVFHQLFEGLSLGIRISTLPSGSRTTRILPVILCILFAITAPIGVVLGVMFLPSSPNAANINGPLLVQPQDLGTIIMSARSDTRTSLLTQGLLCALSAGMLIYAAGVEMLAGDFVMDPEMRQLSVWKQGLGLVSLILGAIAMGVVSIWS